MGKKASSSKSKEVLVDEEEALKVIENQEFIAMRVAEKIWPSPTTIEDQLRELVSDGLIQDQGLVIGRLLANIGFLSLALVRLFSLSPSSMLDSTSQHLLFSSFSLILWYFLKPPYPKRYPPSLSVRSSL
jgi:hypothetical protein